MEMFDLYIIISVLFIVTVVIGLIWWKRSWLEALDMLDWLHLVSVTTGTAQMIFILWYYVPLMQWRSDGSPIAADGTDGHRDKFISDFLFIDSVYRAVMTFFVALQLGVCALFVTRLRSRQEDGPFMFCVEITLFVCAWLGWTTLCAQYTNPADNGMSKVHAAGVGIFIACSLAYLVMMSWNVFMLFTEFGLLAMAEFALLAVLLLTSVVLGVHFIYCALKKDPDAWVTEHLAFVFFVACHVLLFCIDSSHHRHRYMTAVVEYPVEPLVQPTPKDSKYSAMLDGVRIQFGPQDRRVFVDGISIPVGN